jgi:hypothetical protein
MHTYRRTKQKRRIERPHFARILAFVHRNRFAVASQIQRRFSDVLRSDRTARRHLEQMEALGYLGVAPARGVGPLFPKVFYVTGCGVRKLSDSLNKRGKPWQAVRVDRRGRQAGEGYSAEQIIHELMITEFLLGVWETGNRQPETKILAMERRSLMKHPAFSCAVGRQTTRLKPDAMFLVRHDPGGMICNFVEVDLGNMGKKQLRAKFKRYEAWSQSAGGQQYLIDLYKRHGAAEPRPIFRLLVIAKDRVQTDDRRRLVEIARSLKGLSDSLRNRIRMATVADLRSHQQRNGILATELWKRIEEVEGIEI